MFRLRVRALLSSMGLATGCRLKAWVAGKKKQAAKAACEKKNDQRTQTSGLVLRRP